ncbi:hypothetical protein T439DRAFT_301459 [Meredithblackwellia eburnea MCA 4105]
MGSINPTPQIFDIVIYGGTSATVAAAIQSARNGLTVGVVSPDSHIGGIQIEGLGFTDIDNHVEFQNSTTVGGLALELHQRISAVYGRKDRLDEVMRKGIKDPEVWRFESRVAEKVIREWLAEFPSITIIYGELVEGRSVGKDGNHITSIILESGETILGKVFMDCTYEGDLLAAAGISTVVGRESNSKYGESLAGIREQTPYRQFTTPIDPYVVPGDPSSGLLYGVSDEPFGNPGDGDSHLAAFSFRVPLTDVPSNKIPLSPPEDYRSSDYDLHRRFALAGGEFYVPKLRLPSRKTDLIGSEATLATDLLGMNDRWATGSRRVRREILKEATRFTKGLLWFWATDPCVPEEVRNAWSALGYPKDEFPDNDHFPRQLYVRDARRMVSDYVITEHTASRDSGEAQVEDPIAVAFWPTDFHAARRIVRDGAVHNEGFVFKDGHRWRPFGVAYRAVVPKREEATNLFAPTCPSSTHVGYGAVRLEHQFYSIAQACAFAAQVALEKNVAVQDVPYEDLKPKLVKGGIVVDVNAVGVPVFPDEE